MSDTKGVYRGLRSEIGVVVKQERSLIRGAKGSIVSGDHEMPKDVRRGRERRERGISPEIRMRKVESKGGGVTRGRTLHVNGEEVRSEGREWGVNP